MTALFTCLFIFTFPPAPRQIMSNPTQWYINTQTYSTRVFNGVVANSMLLKKGNAARSAPVSKEAKSATQFKPVASLLPKLLAEKVPEDKRDSAVKFFQSHLDLYRQTAQKDGFPSNDLAYAMEYFVVNNYHLYHNLIDSPNGVTMAQERAVYGQFQKILGSNDGIRKMTDLQKQQTAETLAIMFGVAFQANQSKDPKLVEQSRALAREGLEKLFGTPIAKIKITNQGVEI